MTFVVHLLHASHIHWYFIEASQNPSAVRMVGAFILNMGEQSYPGRNNYRIHWLIHWESMLPDSVQDNALSLLSISL